MCTAATDWIVRYLTREDRGRANRLMIGSRLGEREAELEANSAMDEMVTVAGRGSEEGEWPELMCTCWIGRELEEGT
jgi:hypothetical protein